MRASPLVCMKTPSPPSLRPRPDPDPDSQKDKDQSPLLQHELIGIQHSDQRQGCGCCVGSQRLASWNKSGTRNIPRLKVTKRDHLEFESEFKNHQRGCKSAVAPPGLLAARPSVDRRLDCCCSSTVPGSTSTCRGQEQA